MIGDILKVLAKPRSETQSVEAAEAQHAAATAALDTARSAVAAAQEAFDEDGSDVALKALDKALEAQRLASQHVARAERLLTAAKQAEEDTRRAGIESRMAELDARLDRDVVRQSVALLNEEESNLLRRVADVRLRRLDLVRELSAVMQERDSCLTLLGRGGTGSPSAPWFSVEVRSLARVADALRDALPPEDGHPLRRILSRLIAGLREGV